MRAPPLPDRGAAIFLDFDGTLVDLAPRPDAVILPEDLRPLLLRALEGLGGALALISGRSLSDLDALLDPVILPAAGVHGRERRLGSGSLLSGEPLDLRDACALVDELCARHPRLVVEKKSGAIALHYRLEPSLEALVRASMEQALAVSPGMTLLQGKQVVELVPADGGKARAVRAFLDESPFAGRMPWFLGDDVTDEGALAAVQELGGIGVKVGAGPSVAEFRLGNPAEVLVWLARAIARLESARAGSRR